MTTGERIRAARKNIGLTQKALGDKCQMPDSQIRQYELGMVNPKVETLKRIADALNIPVSELIDPAVFQLSKDVIDLFSGSDTLNLDIKGTKINELFFELNDMGQDKAIEQVELLTKIPEYKKDPEPPAL